MRSQETGTVPTPPFRLRHRRYALLLAFLVLVGLLAVWYQPRPSASAEPIANTPQARLAAGPSIFTVDKCPPNYQKTVYSPGQIVYLGGNGFRPLEPIYWDIWGMTNSCDSNTRVAHSRMTADANGSFCIYCYTVANDDCGRYRVVVNGIYTAYYDVQPPGPTATMTSTPTPRATPTSIYVPTTYTFSGYIYELQGSAQPAPENGAPLAKVTMKLYFLKDKLWRLVDETESTPAGWFALSYITDAENLRFRVTETDPDGYESVAAVPPPLYGAVLDANTIELRMPYARNAGVMYFYDRRAIPTATPTWTATITGTPPTPTETLTPIPTHEIITRVLQQGVDGYAGVEDTYISSWFIHTNYSRYNQMSVRSGNLMSALLRFDLSFIPSNSLVLSAKLSVYAPSAGQYRMNVDAFRVYRPWVVNEADWLQAYKNYKWAEPGCNKPGGDHAEKPSDRRVFDKTGKWYEFDLSEMAQDWVSSQPSNQGVILKGSGEIAVQWNLYSSEYWQVPLRPKLSITYAITGPTPTMTPTRRPTATPTDTATPTQTPPPPPF